VAEAIGYGEAVDWIRAFAAAVAEQREELTRLDRDIGDGDHGTNMDRGMRAAVERLDGLDDGDVAAALKAVGMALISKVGGAAGPLYGTFFMQLGTSAAGQAELDLAAWTKALDAGLEGVKARGKAEPGDKTMVDALTPAVEALRQAVDEGASLQAGLARSAAAAREGMEATVPLVARKGRASYLGERSKGHQDPGATSSWLLLRSAAEALG
jgi:phosphoenolpyruvate---glycerone phosphotransferase subunit DhaL